MQLTRTQADFPGLVFLTSVDSTNLEMARRLGDSPAEFFAIAAAEQTAGLGRLGRSWVSEPETSLSLSLLLKPKSIRQAGFATLLAANSVHRALTGLTSSSDIGIKWPNDILLSGKKLSGILANLQNGYVVLGIGVNLRPQAQAPETATALSHLGEYSFDDVLHALLVELTRSWKNFTETDQNASEIAYLINHCVTLGQKVRAELPDGTSVSGLAKEITASGQLIIEGEERYELSAADVWHLRN